jgi:hypothetical protein
MAGRSSPRIKVGAEEKKKKPASEGVQECRRVLNELGEEFKEGKSFPDLKSKKPLQFDFYLINRKACVEYDGEFHFKGNYEEDQRDKLKDDYCERNEIPLLRIAPSEVKNIDKIIGKFLEVLNIGIKRNFVIKKGYEYKVKEQPVFLKLIGGKQSLPGNGNSTLTVLSLDELKTSRRKKEFDSRWEGQRPINEFVVTEIRNYVLQNYNKKSFNLGNITIVLNAGKNCEVIDGQHRISALWSISDKTLEENPKLLQLNVHLEIYEDLSPEQIGDLFTTINKSNTVPSLYLNKEQKQNKDLAEDFIKYLVDTFPANMKKNTKTAKLPNVSIGELQAELGKELKDLIDEKQITGELTDLENKVKILNKKLGEELTAPSGFDFFKRKNKEKKSKAITAKEFKNALNAVKEKEKSDRPICYLGFLFKCSWLELIGSNMGDLGV